MTQGFDASYFQSVIDWAAVKASGKAQFAYARATQGISYTDPTFRRNHDTAKLREIPIGAYHFWMFADDPEAQAEHFLSQTYRAGRFGENLPMVDVEEGSFVGIPTVAAACTALARFLSPIEAILGKKMIRYTNYDTWQRFFGNTSAFSDGPLWLAQTENPASGLYGGWKDYLLWQDGTTEIPGITGAVDYDTLNPARPLADLTR